jgi:hypothetical protein
MMRPQIAENLFPEFFICPENIALILLKILFADFSEFAKL